MKTVGRGVLFLVIVGVVAVGLMMYRPASPGSFILSGGEILTLNPDQQTVEAVLVKDGLIADLGSLTELKKTASDAELIDLEGATLAPGLIEPHTHPIASALLGATVDVSGFKHKDRSSIIDALKDAAGGIGLTPWVVAYGWDPLVIPDLTAPSLDELDAISPDKPMVIITQMLHEVFVNSRGLEAAGMDINNPNQNVEGFLRDENGRLTGTVKEVEAVGKIIEHMPSASNAITELLLRLKYVKYAKAGYTTIGVAGAVGRHPDPVGLLEKVGNNPDSPLRTFVYMLPDQLTDKQYAKTADFKIKGVKYWMDGSPFTGGAALEGTYENTELVTERLGLPRNHSGPLNHSREEFQSVIKGYHEKGLQIAVHVQGERAVEEVLLAIDAAQNAKPNPELHHRLEHNALITADQMLRVKKLGMTLGFFVDHIYYYGDVLPDLMGTERMKRYMPLKSALNEGIIITIHGDHPATPIAPLRSMRTAINRLSESGRTVSGKEEALSNLEALQALTINGALQLGEQENIGSITVGKRADFVVFSENPLEQDASKLPDIEILDVYKNGQRSDTRLISPDHLGLVWDILVEKLSGK